MSVEVKHIDKPISKVPINSDVAFVSCARFTLSYSFTDHYVGIP